MDADPTPERPVGTYLAQTRGPNVLLVPATPPAEAPPVGISAAPPTEPSAPPTTQMLLDMGFTGSQAESALAQTGGDVQRAVSKIVGSPD